MWSATSTLAACGALTSFLSGAVTDLAVLRGLRAPIVCVAKIYAGNLWLPRRLSTDSMDRERDSRGMTAGRAFFAPRSVRTQRVRAQLCDHGQLALAGG